MSNIRVQKKLYNIAIEIDRLSEIKGRALNRNQVIKILKNYNPKFIANGGFKRVFRIGTNKFYAFKIGNPNDIKIQNKIYLSLKRKRKFKYAKIYWATKYCQLQRFCITVKLTNKELEKIKVNAKDFGFYDARLSNLGKYKGQIVAFDLMPRKINLLNYEKIKDYKKIEFSIAPDMDIKTIKKQLKRILISVRIFK